MIGINFRYLNIFKQHQYIPIQIIEQIVNAGGGNLLFSCTLNVRTADIMNMKIFDLMKWTRNQSKWEMQGSKHYSLMCRIHDFIRCSVQKVNSLNA